MKIFFLYLFACSGLLASSPLRVEVSAKGAILMNAETGAVVWEKNAHTPLFPASTTKLITALYLVEKKGFALDEMVTASHDAVSAVTPGVRRAGHGAHPPYRLEFGGTHMGIKPGEVLSFRTLLYGLMLNSANDAANVLAQYVSGDVPIFMEELNKFVREKGCKNTVLHTPHGLSHDEHKTTAYDMAILSREFLKHSLLREVVRTARYPRHATNMQPESVMHQHNALVKPGRFFYPKAIGIKTGYTTAAGFTLVAAAEDANRKLIAVLLGCETMDQRYKDAIALFEAGFNEKKVSRILFSKGFDVFSSPVEGGKTLLQAYLSQDIALEYYPSEEPVFKSAVLWQTPPLPVAEGQRVGVMQITGPEGKILAEAPLYAMKGVEATLSYRANAVWKKVNLTLVMGLAGALILAGTFHYSRRRSL